MKSIVLSLFAETFIHPGCGQNDGAIDLPVAKERATSYPFIAGSSHKGAWRDYARHNIDKKEIPKIFGETDEAAGQLLINEARLLLLPVRSLQASYCWVTCPMLLERHARDWERAMGEDITSFTNIGISEEEYIGKKYADNDILFLEERSFSREETISADLIDHLKKLIPNPTSKERLADQLVIINDLDFKWFVENALPIQARNELDSETKQSQNLWYEESLPPDSLFTAIISQRDADNQSLDTLTTKISEHSYLQIGGNETVGQGWFKLGVSAKKEEEKTEGAE